MSPDDSSFDCDHKLATARSVETQLCPACGQPNTCARAGNTKAANCWCFAIALTPEVLQRVRQKYPTTACLCRSCLERERAAFESARL
jgi:hypothetical protein